MLGDMERKITLVAIMVTVISLGLTSPAYATHEPEFVEAEWTNLASGALIDTPTAPTNFDFHSDSIFGDPDFDSVPINASCDPGDLICSIDLANFDDGLDIKTIELELRFGSTPPSISLEDVTTGGTDPGGDAADCIVNFVDVDVDLDEVHIGVTCTPNPIDEFVNIQFDSIPDMADITDIFIDTVSFDDVEVGGTFVPIDNSALILAGAQSISMWMIPVVIAGIGIGVFVIKRRK